MLNVYFKVFDATTLPILNELRQKRYRTICCWVSDKDKDKEQIRNIRDLKTIKHSDIDNHLTCYNWDITQCQIYPEYDGLEHLVFRSLNENTPFVCIDNCQHCNNMLVLFQDAKHKTDYPQCFVKVPCFHRLEDLMDYALQNGVFSFSLKDTPQFGKCNGIKPVQGATVYKEQASGRYWYMDMLHKTHYEVFDHQGRHLGEADLTGVLNKEKKDSRKRITI